MKPIVQLFGPDPSSRVSSLNLVDWGNGIASAATKSGLIAAALAALQTLDTSQLPPWQTFMAGFGVLVCTTMLRLYATGKPETPPATLAVVMPEPKPPRDTDEFTAMPMGGV